MAGHTQMDISPQWEHTIGINETAQDLRLSMLQASFKCCPFHLPNGTVGHKRLVSRSLTNVSMLHTAFRFKSVSLIYIQKKKNIPS
jgi:hypothetical protein